MRAPYRCPQATRLAWSSRGVSRRRPAADPVAVGLDTGTGSLADEGSARLPLELELGKSGLTFSVLPVARLGLARTRARSPTPRGARLSSRAGSARPRARRSPRHRRR